MLLANLRKSTLPTPRPLPIVPCMCVQTTRPVENQLPLYKDLCIWQAECFFQGKSEEEAMGMSPGNGNNWRQICEQVLKEKNPEKVTRLLEELLEILEERAANGDQSRTSRPSSSVS